MLKKKRDFTLAAVAITLLVAFNASRVEACLCPPSSVKQRVRTMKIESDAIFAGTVISVDEIAVNSLKVVISVEMSWKESKTVEEYTLYTSGTSGGGCGVAFIKGKSYLVYAKKGKDDRLVTEICWGTGELSLAKKDLKLLGRPVSTKSGWPAAAKT